MADPTNISRAQKLLEEMNAKYGATPSAQPAPQVAPPPVQVQPTPQPQQRGLVNDAMGLIKGRQQQIDKAAGYACGGKIKGHAQGGLIRGPGTSTSDSIPAKNMDTGEDILVSNGERIISADQDKLLGRIAQMLGFESVDQLLASGTGKPVGPTIKGGKRAAEGGLYLDNNPDEYNKAMESRQPIISGMFPNTSSVYKEVGKDVGTAMDNGNYGNALGLATRGALATGVGVIDDVIGNPIRAALPVVKNIGSGLVGNVQAPSVTQYQRPSSSPVVGGANSVDAQEAMREKEMNRLMTTGRDSFTQGGNNYAVNPTSQDGIQKVTGGSSPLYTNINPEQAVAGLKNQMIGGDAASVNEGLARYANANRIRGEMIANRDKDIPAGGYGPSILGDGGIAADNAEKTQRWRNDELMQQAKRGNQAAIGAIIQSEANRDAAIMGNETNRQNARLNAQVANNRDQITMRGQDINERGDMLRYGNPLDQQAKQLAFAQAQKIAQLQEKASMGDVNAINELRVRGALKLPDDKWELGYRKSKDVNTGLETQEPVVVTRDYGKQGVITPQQEYQNAIAAAKGDANKIKLIQDRARQNGVIQ